MHANQNLELHHFFNLQMTSAVCANGLLSKVKGEFGTSRLGVYSDSPPKEYKESAATT